MMADRPRLGSGGRFRQLVAQGKSPALAAFIGRKKHGARKMAKMAATGRRRAARKSGSAGSY
jgi:hypothetical protein